MYVKHGVLSKLCFKQLSFNYAGVGSYKRYINFTMLRMCLRSSTISCYGSFVHTCLILHTSGG